MKGSSTFRTSWTNMSTADGPTPSIWQSRHQPPAPSRPTARLWGGNFRQGTREEEYSQVFAVFMWCFLFVFHCFPLISIVFHWFLFHWFAYCFSLASIATGPQEVIEIREDDCGNRVSWLLGIKKFPYCLKREVQPAEQAMQNQA